MTADVWAISPYGLGTDNGDENFCSLKAHAHMIRKQSRTVNSPFLYRSITTKSEVTRLLAVPLDAGDVFFMTFIILQDSYMEPTPAGSDRDCFYPLLP